MRPFAMLAFLFCLVSSGSAEEWLRAEVYAIECGTETGANLSLQDVREHSEHSRVFRSKDIAPLLELLQLRSLRPNHDSHPKYPRIVIDLFTDTDARVTYYSDGASIQTEDNRYSHAVDGSFCRRMREITRIHK